MIGNKNADNILDKALYDCRAALFYVFIFSMAANALIVALPIYSLQVLDRVLGSQSYSTLIMLTIITLAIFVFFGLVQAARSFAMIRIGDWLDEKLAPQFLQSSIAISASKIGFVGNQMLRDLNNLRNFLTSAGLNAIFDAPWSIIFIIILYIIHPVFGIAILLGGLLLLLTAYLSELAVKEPLNQANDFAIKSLNLADNSARNAETVEAMGMMQNVTKKWNSTNKLFMELQSLASSRAGVIASITKFIRLTLQILVTCIGAVLVLQHQITAGSMIAASILAGKALSPFETAIDSIKSMINTQKAYGRIKEALKITPDRRSGMSLPAPKGEIKVENLVYGIPGQPAIIKGMNFVIQPGEVVGIIGPSGAGKSTLARLLVGVWKANSGIVRLDGADLYKWNRDEVGKYIGYLPQTVELFSGTVKENIARLAEDIDPEQVVLAAQIAGAHDMILRLQNGYETDIGMNGGNLSGGQKQRIGLARAFYGTPKLLILDEPNSNLDQDGELALVAAVQKAKQNGSTTIVITHRPSILNYVDKIMAVNEGLIIAYGEKNEMLKKFILPAPQPASPTQSHIAQG